MLALRALRWLCRFMRMLTRCHQHCSCVAESIGEPLATEELQTAANSDEKTLVQVWAALDRGTAPCTALASPLTPLVVHSCAEL